MTDWTLLPATAFAAHGAQWQALNEAGPASPLFDIEFVQPALTEFGNGKELFAIARVGAHIVAMAILTPCRTGAWETFQPSQAPIGIWMHVRGADVPALLERLMGALPGLPLVLGITQCDPYLMARPDNNAALQTIDYIDTARITIAGDFEHYWAARGKNLRSNLKKQRARLIKENIRVRMETVRAPEHMAEAIADYGRLESAGWKAEGGTAIHPDNAQGRFYSSMLAGFCRRDAASVIRYWFDDRLVAMNLCIEGHGRLIVLKTTYDESVPSHYSPAFLMREETCQHMFQEKKFAALEFYGKVMEWHMRWTDEVRTLYHINTYRWPVLLRLHRFVQQRARNQRQRETTVAAAAIDAAPVD